MSRRLVVFYVALLASVAVALAVILPAGVGRRPQAKIAGGYNVTAGRVCTGPKLDVRQSGQFITLQDPQGSGRGNLRFRNGVLLGDVTCRGGKNGPARLRAVGGGLRGEVGGRPFLAAFARDPPPPGRPRPRIPASLRGDYALSPRSSCLGGTVTLGSGNRPTVRAGEKKLQAQLSYRDGQLTGVLNCRRGDIAQVNGTAADRTLDFQLTPPRGAVLPERAVEGRLPAGGEKISAAKKRDLPKTAAAFFIAVAIVMVVARLMGLVAMRLGQPRVMGEIVAGILLGPTLLGTLSPGLEATLFPTDVLPFIGVVANFGLIFYMFLVGLELDPAQLRGRVSQAAAISNASVALPMILGLAVAVPLYPLLAPPGTSFLGFALFMGVAMSITAFPVLARILVERRMLRRPLGALTLACAAIDDVTAWFLVALATTVAVAGSSHAKVAKTVVLAIAFCIGMALLVRPILARMAGAYDEAGRVPPGWIAAIFAGVLLCAWTTETIGIALIFGAFVMGLAMPRHAGLSEHVAGRIEDLVVILLLPLFFAFTGLRTNVGLLDRGELWLLTGLLLLIAVVGKLFGAFGAARLTGFRLRESAVIGVLMNARGLTELIVLNLALDIGTISEDLFTMLVLMALVTTFMTGPALRILDPHNELGAPVGEELEEARKATLEEFPTVEVPERAILVAPRFAPLHSLLAVAEPLARSTPPRELILARLIDPPTATAVRSALTAEDRLLAEAWRETGAARERLLTDGVAARAAAFVSVDPGQDLVRLTEREEIDLVLLDGRRPLVGAAVPRLEAGEALADAPCDVGVLVVREGEEIRLGPGAPIVLPFGGADNDWAALELGGWVAAATGAELRLLGAAGQTEDRGRVSRRLADVGLLLQQYAGVPAATEVIETGSSAVLAAAEDAALLVIGVSDRWRSEGLGEARSALARRAPAPVLFVRRGHRPGALAPAGDITRFTWSASSPPLHAGQ